MSAPRSRTEPARHPHACHYGRVTAAVSGLFDPSVREDPHVGYHRARAASPVGYDAGRDEWFALSWRACETALRGEGWSSDPTTWKPVRDDEASRTKLETGERLRRFIVFLDPPSHTRLRSLVVKAFTPRVVRELQGWIEERVGQLADEAEERRESAQTPIDLVDFAGRVPIEVICRLLAVPVHDVEQVNRWSQDAVRVFDLPELAPEEAVEVVASTRALNAYLRQVIDERRQAPGNDLLSALIAAEDDGDRLNEIELQSLVAFLFVAGHETTASLTSNTLFALLAHPEQWAAVVDEPALAARAVEEGLRWDGPLHSISRIALGPQVLDGVAIPDGALVNVVLAAANRDPVRFVDPDRFDVEREPVSNLGFGFGPHYCIGAALGRAEAVTTVRTLAAKWPNLRLACDAADTRHRPHLFFRGLTNVPAFIAS